MIPKQSVLCGEDADERRIHNNWCGDLGSEPPAAGGKEVWGKSPQRLAIFTILNEINKFFGIFRLTFLLKNTFLISLII